MMGRLARELMLSGQGAAGLQQFKVLSRSRPAVPWWPASFRLSAEQRC